MLKKFFSVLKGPIMVSVAVWSSPLSKTRNLNLRVSVIFYDDGMISWVPVAVFSNLRLRLASQIYLNGGTPRGGGSSKQ